MNRFTKEKKVKGKNEEIVKKRERNGKAGKGQQKKKETDT